MEIKHRLFGPDRLRVVACYLVIQVHAGEFYYIGEEGNVLPGCGPYWIALFNSLGRAAIPLFIMITGYFVLPVRDSLSVFFKKRFTRVAVPFVVWCILYALYGLVKGEATVGETGLNILKIPVNYGTEVGHLWYVYMLIGLYLVFPVISPWLQIVSCKVLTSYLLIWGGTLLLPYIHQVFPEVLGECFWNQTPLLYYFSGLLGYAVLGFYIKKFCTQPKTSCRLWGILLLLSGWVVTAGVFYHRISTQEYVWDLELSWGYETLNVAFMAIGLFFLLKDMSAGNSWISKSITSISNMSYGMYLVHIMVLNFFYWVFNGRIEEIWLLLSVLSVCTFVVSYFIIRILSYLPKSKYIIG
ncbi:MAG: acyltransferase family protein [Candidatus Azobacteroides sp.]|nr:acyltransferase family protein [Candidatus Azobacteroides sp.]